MKPKANIPAKETDLKALSMAELIDAAWHFSYATLWQERMYSKTAILLAKKHIRYYLVSHPLNRQQVFTQFIQRIMVADLCVTANETSYLCKPSAWFNGRNRLGFEATLSTYTIVQSVQAADNKFVQGIAIAAQSYWDYIRSPSPEIVSECRSRLLELREFKLIQIFYNAIIYHQFLHPKSQEICQSQKSSTEG